MKIASSPTAAGLVVRLLLLAATAMAASSCHTTAGLGQDLRHVGQKIESTAERVH